MRIRAAKTTAFLPDFRTIVRLVRIGIVDAAQTNPFAPAKVAPILRRHGLELETLDEGMSLAAHVAGGGGERNVDERGKRRRSGCGVDAAAARDGVKCWVWTGDGSDGTSYCSAVGSSQ